MPATIDARLNDVRIEFVNPALELREIGLGSDATTMCRQTRAEHIGDQNELHLLADRAGDTGGCAEILGGPDELGVGIAQLIATQASATELVDDRAAFEAMIDDCATWGSRTNAIAKFAK
jgi:hypothetical protein